MTSDLSYFQFSQMMQALETIVILSHFKEIKFQPIFALDPDGEVTKHEKSTIYGSLVRLE